MIAIRWHGRGGHGVLTAAQLLAQAVARSGLYVQALPHFGPERRGAPVIAFTRVSPKPIEVRTRVYEPDVVAVLDSTLVKSVRVWEGLKPAGAMILNAEREPESLRDKFSGFRLFLVDATSIAMDTLGMNMPNTAMLGAVIRVTGLADLADVEEVVMEALGEKNVKALKTAFQNTKEVGG
ncbi:MAG: 2-oxoacid:acceptor oxidoreductase family protein [Candidatus Bathyarchaeia archaeon]